MPSIGIGSGKDLQALPSPQLVRAAHEFEGQLMQELLKPLTESDGLTGSTDESGSGSALGEFAAESLAQGISRQGGFGIANQVVRELSRFGNGATAGKVTGDVHRNTVLRKSL